MSWQILQSDVTNPLPLKDNSVQCVVTSPPYWGLRDYGTASWAGGDARCDHIQGRPGSGRADGIVDDRFQRNRDGAGAMGGDCRKCGATRIDRQLGLEATPELYVERMVAVFREIKRVLRDDGTVWVNLGDSYATNPSGSFGKGNNGRGMEGGEFRSNKPYSTVVGGLKPKDLCGIPWRVAFALQADGWYLRSDIIWSKPNPMPESVTDRPCKSHEYIFLLTKQPRYYYDAEAIKEDAAESLGSQVEYERQSQSSSTALLLFGERASHQKSTSPAVSTNGTAKRALQGNGANQKQRSQTQSANSEVLAEREGEEAQSSQGQALSINDEWQMGEAPSGIETEICTEAIDADADGVDRDQGAISESLRILSSREALREGSRNPAIEGWTTHQAERSASVSDVQRPKRTARSVWHIATEPFPQSHFATFPTELAERCIKAGTSEKGACSVCGAPYERMTEKTGWPDPDSNIDDQGRMKGNGVIATDTGRRKELSGARHAAFKAQNPDKFLGWQPTCTHDAPTTPCVVLDPFSGAGTTALVADKLGRFGIGLELKKEYCDMAHKRCYDDAPLLAWAD